MSQCVEQPLEGAREPLLKKPVLYLFPAAMESMKAHVGLFETDFPPFSVQSVDLFRGVFSPTFALLQPSCTVPVLLMPNGKTFRDAEEILTFVHNAYPSKGELNLSSEVEASVKEFSDLVSSWDEIEFSFGNPYASRSRGLIEMSVVWRIRMGALRKNLRMYGQRYPALVSTYLKRINELEKQDFTWDLRVEKALESSRVLEQILDRAEEHLSKNQFLFGGIWTIADSMLVPVLHRITELGHGQRIERRINLTRYFVMVTGRPSFQLAIAPFDSSWMRRNFYKKLLIEILLRALPYVAILLVFVLIVVMAIAEHAHHITAGGHGPFVPPDSP